MSITEKKPLIYLLNSGGANFKLEIVIKTPASMKIGAIIDNADDTGNPPANAEEHAVLVKLIDDGSGASGTLIHEHLQALTKGKNETFVKVYVFDAAAGSTSGSGTTQFEDAD